MVLSSAVLVCMFKKKMCRTAAKGSCDLLVVLLVQSCCVLSDVLSCAWVYLHIASHSEKAFALFKEFEEMVGTEVLEGASHRSLI